MSTLLLSERVLKTMTNETKLTSAIRYQEPGHYVTFSTWTLCLLRGHCSHYAKAAMLSRSLNLLGTPLDTYVVKYYETKL